MNQYLKHGGPGVPSSVIGAFGVILCLVILLLGLVLSYTKNLTWFSYSLIGTLLILDTFLLAWGLILGIKGFYHPPDLGCNPVGCLGRRSCQLRPGNRGHVKPEPLALQGAVLRRGTRARPDTGSLHDPGDSGPGNCLCKGRRNGLLCFSYLQ